MPGFFLTNSIQLSQVSALVNLTDISLPFGMVGAFKCLDKETKTTKNTVQGKFRMCTVLKSVHEPIRVRENLSLRDSSRMRTRTRTWNGSMDACLSFTTVSIFTDTDTYTDHGHGSQITDLWMASLNQTVIGLEESVLDSRVSALLSFI